MVKIWPSSTNPLFLFSLFVPALCVLLCYSIFVCFSTFSVHYIFLCHSYFCFSTFSIQYIFLFYSYFAFPFFSVHIFVLLRSPCPNHTVYTLLVYLFFSVPPAGYISLSYSYCHSFHLHLTSIFPPHSSLPLNPLPSTGFLSGLSLYGFLVLASHCLTQPYHPWLSSPCNISTLKGDKENRQRDSKPIICPFCVAKSLNARPSTPPPLRFIPFPLVKEEK